MEVRTATGELAQLRAVVAAVVSLSPAEMEPVEAAAAHREVRALCDKLLGFAARLLPRVEEDGRWAAGGARTFAEWSAQQRGTSVGAARAESALGRALEADLPASREAVTQGSMTLEHAQVLARLGPTSEARRAALASGGPGRDEASLVAKAQRMGVDEYRREVKRWAARVDSAAQEREHRAAVERERLVLVRKDDGVAIDGFLTVEHGDVLLTALRAVTGVPAKDDRRTPEQRRAAALSDLARVVLDKGLVGGGAQVRPHLSVHVSWETFRRLADESGTGAPAELDDGEPIPRSVLARIACDSEVSRIVFGPESRPLDVGRSQRTFTGAQRRGVIARDRTCRFPGCGKPPVLGEVHHVRWWIRDHGPTAVDNGILLCWHHHDLVHQRNLRITRVDGGWRFARSDGSPVEPTRRAPWATGGPPGERPLERDGAPPGAEPVGAGSAGSGACDGALPGRPPGPGGEDGRRPVGEQGLVVPAG